MEGVLLRINMAVVGGSVQQKIPLFCRVSFRAVIPYCNVSVLGLVQNIRV